MCFTFVFHIKNLGSFLEPMFVFFVSVFLKLHKHLHAEGSSPTLEISFGTALFMSRGVHLWNKKHFCCLCFVCKFLSTLMNALIHVHPFCVELFT